MKWLSLISRINFHCSTLASSFNIHLSRAYAPILILVSTAGHLYRSLILLKYTSHSPLHPGYIQVSNHCLLLSSSSISLPTHIIQLIYCPQVNSLRCRHPSRTDRSIQPRPGHHKPRIEHRPARRTPRLLYLSELSVWQGEHRGLSVPYGLEEGAGGCSEGDGTVPGQRHVLHMLATPQQLRLPRPMTRGINTLSVTPETASPPVSPGTVTPYTAPSVYPSYYQDDDLSSAPFATAFVPGWQDGYVPPAPSAYVPVAGSFGYNAPSSYSGHVYPSVFQSDDLTPVVPPSPTPSIDFADPIWMRIGRSWRTFCQRRGSKRLWP